MKLLKFCWWYLTRFRGEEYQQLKAIQLAVQSPSFVVMIKQLKALNFSAGMLRPDTYEKWLMAQQQVSRNIGHFHREALRCSPDNLQAMVNALHKLMFALNQLTDCFYLLGAVERQQEQHILSSPKSLDEKWADLQVIHHPIIHSDICYFYFDHTAPAFTWSFKREKAESYFNQRLRQQVAQSLHERIIVAKSIVPDIKLVLVGLERVEAKLQSHEALNQRFDALESNVLATHQQSLDKASSILTQIQQRLEAVEQAKLATDHNVGLQKTLASEQQQFFNDVIKDLKQDMANIREYFGTLKAQQDALMASDVETAPKESVTLAEIKGLISEMKDE